MSAVLNITRGHAIKFNIIRLYWC